MIISLNQIRGWLAHCVVRQHPYHSTAGIEAVNARIAELPIWDRSVPNFEHVRVGSWRELEDMIRPAIVGSREAEEWNTPRSKHSRQTVFSSRYDAPSPEDDFIDIEALIRNVTLGAFREDRDEDGDSDLTVAQA